MTDSPETPDSSETPDRPETPEGVENPESAEAEPQEERNVEPDHPDTLAALQDLGARMDVNPDGRIWRIFFYDRNTDDDLAHIHGLEDLKEIWLLGSKVTAQGVTDFRERLPEVKVHY